MKSRRGLVAILSTAALVIGGVAMTAVPANALGSHTAWCLSGQAQYQYSSVAQPSAQIATTQGSATCSTLGVSAHIRYNLGTAAWNTWTYGPSFIQQSFSGLYTVIGGHHNTTYTGTVTS